MIAFVCVFGLSWYRFVLFAYVCVVVLLLCVLGNVCFVPCCLGVLRGVVCVLFFLVYSAMLCSVSRMCCYDMFVL